MLRPVCMCSAQAACRATSHGEPAAGLEDLGSVVKQYSHGLADARGTERLAVDILKHLHQNCVSTLGHKDLSPQLCRNALK